MRRKYSITTMLVIYTLFAFIMTGITGQESNIKTLKKLDRAADTRDINDNFREIRNSLPLDVAVGSFTCPAATGNKAVTGVGFTPRYVTFTCCIDAGTIISQGTGRIDYNGNQGYTYWAYDPGGGGGVRQASGADTYCILVRTGGNVNKVFAAYVSMDKDGFTINFSVVDTNYLITWQAFR